MPNFLIKKSKKKIAKLQKINISNFPSSKDTELEKIKDEQNEQAKMIKKLQRKLLLVSKERDTSRAILDSFEKELTVSGKGWRARLSILPMGGRESYKGLGGKGALAQYKVLV